MLAATDYVKHFFALGGDEVKPNRWVYIIIGIPLLIGGIFMLCYQYISGISFITLGLVSIFNAYLSPKVFSNDPEMVAIRHKCGFLSFFASIIYALILYTLIQFEIIFNVVLGMIVVVNLMIITMFVYLLIYSKKEEEARRY